VEAIVTDKAPKAIGHYSQAIQVGDLLFLSGQISIDPKTNELCLFDGDVVRQTEQVMKNIEGVLAAKELTLNAVVKTTVFLKDISQFPKFNEVYAKFLGDHKPARSAVEVSNLPKGVAIEIEAVACLSKK